MVRLSDLIGKGKDGTRPPSPQGPGGVPASGPAAPPAAAPAPVAPRPPSQSAAAAALIASEQATQQMLFDLETLYGKLIMVVRILFDQARTSQPLPLVDAIHVLEGLPQTKTDRCEAVLSLAQRHTEENYLYSHSVNVALLSYHLSLCLGYSVTSGRQLALAGLLHDIGMAGEAEKVAAVPRRLTEEEWKVISRHPAEAVERLKDAQGLSRKALEAIAAHHPHQPEKTGTQAAHRPQDTESEYAKILSVCDVYDALTHARTYRKRFSPAQAIKMLIDGVDDQFDRRVVKALVDELSLYPKGSIVKLNTNEIGTVEKVHAEAPLRPVVVVSRDASHQRLTTPRLVNLMERPFIYIKEIVSEEQA